jgi:hypothetical protein
MHYSYKFYFFTSIILIQRFKLRLFKLKEPVTVAARCKACTVFALSEAEIMGLNPIKGMNVWYMYMFILCLCCPVFR